MLNDRNEIIAVSADRIPQELKDAAQWTIWKGEPNSEKQSIDKVPYRAAAPSVKASHSLPSSWSDFSTAHEAYLQRDQTGADGLFFACGNGFGGVDIDACVDPSTGAIHADAWDIIRAIDSYTEYSVSRTGVRIFVRAPEAKGTRMGGVEVYTSKRFLSVTGAHVEGTLLTVEERGEQMEVLRQRLRDQKRAANEAARSASGRTGTRLVGRPHAPKVNVTSLGISDDEVIALCHTFEGFPDLWNGDASAYDGDRSRADLAMAGLLAFACGPDEQERIERIMRQSGLVREKWDRPDYLRELTIPKAYEEREDFYEWPQSVTGVGPQRRRAGELSSVNGQADAQPGSDSTSTAMQVSGHSENALSADVVPSQVPSGHSLEGAEEERPTVVVGPETDAILGEIEYHLSSELYQRNGRLVRVDRTRRGRTNDSVRRPANSIVLADVTPEYAQRIMSRRMIFKKRKVLGRGKKSVVALEQVAAPAAMAKLLTNCGQWSSIPMLVGVTTTPFIRSDGIIVDQPGYDQRSGYLYINDGTVWEPVPATPTAKQVQAAVELLLDVVCDFPFQTAEHKSAWLAQLLTTVGRTAIRGPVPMLWVDGSRAGTGKSKLPRLIGLIINGDEPTEISFTSDEKEMENRLASILLAGDRFAYFDNATGTVRNAVLDRFLTSVYFDFRRFHTQQIAKLLNTATLAVTGNNLSLRGDLARRVLRVRLVTDLERPESRSGFKYPDLEGYVRANRTQLFAAALTILRAHAAAGFPHVSGVQPLGSFYEWERVVRHAMLNTGLPDPVSTQEEVHESNEDDARLEAFLRAWHNMDPHLEGTTTKLIERAAQDMDKYTEVPPEQKAFAEALFELTNTKIGTQPEPAKLGYRLRDALDKKVGGYTVIHPEGRKAEGVVWKLRHESDPPPKPFWASKRRLPVRKPQSPSKRSWTMFHRLIEGLSALCAPAYPVVVKFARLKNEAGTCHRQGRQFVIAISQDLSESEAMDVLMHEWAHALAWNHLLDKLGANPKRNREEFDRASHDAAWGVAYARVWTAFSSDLREWLQIP